MPVKIRRGRLAHGVDRCAFRSSRIDAFYANARPRRAFSGFFASDDKWIVLRSPALTRQEGSDVRRVEPRLVGGDLASAMKPSTGCGSQADGHPVTSAPSALISVRASS